MLNRLVAADDRTGAFEAAALLAGAGSPVTVWVGAAPADGVVDLCTRHVAPDIASQRVAEMPEATWRAHKTDSLLRGNWPAELRALSRRVLLVPAWPAMDRVCVGGVVRAGDRWIGAVRDRLPEARLLPDDDALTHWLGGSAGIGVADAASTERLRAVVAAASTFDDVVVAGPAGAVGEAHDARFGARAAQPCPRAPGPVLVVNGSASPVAHEQVRRLRARRPGIRVLSVPEPTTDLHPDAAQAVAAEARALVDDVATVVVIGGDTASALLGDAPRRVGGFAAPGMPWSLDQWGAGPLVVSKAGAFGGPDALLGLGLR